ncbi:MAG: PAS domain S-box protein [Gammaproteobacteria bacterium]|nr:PAS domain S-box protein [Gammaproteobacteria bacterium]
MPRWRPPRRGIIATDGEWRVLLWNKGAERMFGWTAAEAIGRPADAFTCAASRRNTSGSIARSCRRDGASG